MTDKLFPRFRLNNFRGPLEYFQTMSGVRAHMNSDGSGEIQVVTKDSAGRRKSAAVTVTTDDLLRLHHVLGEALKARGVFLELGD